MKLQDNPELGDDEPLCVFDRGALRDGSSGICALYCIPPVDSLDFRLTLLERLPPAITPPVR